MPSRSFDRQEAGKQRSSNHQVQLCHPRSPHPCSNLSRGVRLGQNLRLANQTPPARLLIVRLVSVYAWIDCAHVPTQQGRSISTNTLIGLNYPHRGTGWRGNKVEDGALRKPRKCVKMLNSQQIPTLF
ncbi:hypothetical protein PTTG_28468 [Puccinia triticina 1-1 BBBD Race 1]|uniref:Uncharacterized protein n=2 Tax=Puccinia triticina TaxID=208348 RepID=A0A180GBP8_PUCT1|nr:uncharacterized protein PtA15_17A293 [Puccinia triticina]OAV90014.1 hypothetical protein PTTG_28468 [Puccinia triticina 1-1 BBBD Race 1]WAQ92811.1 hypothetical protein PtA15_17A293 [Puccinia triticina]